MACSNRPSYICSNQAGFVGDSQMLLCPDDRFWCGRQNLTLSEKGDIVKIQVDSIPNDTVCWYNITTSTPEVNKAKFELDYSQGASLKIYSENGDFNFTEEEVPSAGDSIEYEISNERRLYVLFTPTGYYGKLKMQIESEDDGSEKEIIFKTKTEKAIIMVVSIIGVTLVLLAAAWIVYKCKVGKNQKESTSVSQDPCSIRNASQNVGQFANNKSNMFDLRPAVQDPAGPTNIQKQPTASSSSPSIPMGKVVVGVQLGVPVSQSVDQNEQNFQNP